MRHKLHFCAICIRHTGASDINYHTIHNKNQILWNHGKLHIKLLIIISSTLTHCPFPLTYLRNEIVIIVFSHYMLKFRSGLKLNLWSLHVLTQRTPLPNLCLCLSTLQIIVPLPRNLYLHHFQVQLHLFEAYAHWHLTCNEWLVYFPSNPAS